MPAAAGGLQRVHPASAVWPLQFSWFGYCLQLFDLGCTLDSHLDEDGLCLMLHAASASGAAATAGAFLAS